MKSVQSPVSGWHGWTIWGVLGSDDWSVRSENVAAARAARSFGRPVPRGGDSCWRKLAPVDHEQREQMMHGGSAVGRNLVLDGNELMKPNTRDLPCDQSLQNIVLT